MLETSIMLRFMPLLEFLHRTKLTHEMNNQYKVSITRQVTDGFEH